MTLHPASVGPPVTAPTTVPCGTVLTAAAAAAVSAERDRLRRDLHDGLGASLSGISLALEALRDMLTRAEPAALPLIDRIHAEVATAVADVRRIVDDLRPAALDSGGLVAAVRRRGEILSAALPVDVVAAADLPRVIQAQVASAAYRITSEALANATRRAAAHRVRVTLTASDRSLRIAVDDDGRGMRAEATAGGGVGLASLCRRAEALGGRLHIATSSAGTTVTALLPLQQGAR